MKIENWPTEDTLTYECGSLAAHIYGGKSMTYFRKTDEGKERLLVVNGMVVSHTLEYSDFQVVKNLELEGVWIFGMGISAVHGYRVIRSVPVDTMGG